MQQSEEKIYRFAIRHYILYIERKAQSAVYTTAAKSN